MQNHKIIFLFLYISILFSCNKDKQHPLKGTTVHEYVIINNAENQDLLAPGGSVTTSGGINGIAIYRISEQSFGVYERACPNEPEENCAIELEGAIGECPCCSSKYSLLDGAVIEGPSNWPLLPYSSFFDRSTLFISN